MKRIGIMGGTFDPIHYGHLEMANAAWEQGDLDQVWFMPSKIPPHKLEKHITGETLRTEMIKRAISEREAFVYSDFELKRQGITYTSDTLELLCRQHPEVQWCFILGADSFFQLEHWHEPEKIMKLCTVFAVGRDGVSQRQMEQQKHHLEERYRARIKVLSMPQIDISSSEIRDKIQKGQSIREMVPDAVRLFIDEKQLYRRHR